MGIFQEHFWVKRSFSDSHKLASTYTVKAPWGPLTIQRLFFLPLPSPSLPSFLVQDASLACSPDSSGVLCTRVPTFAVLAYLPAHGNSQTSLWSWAGAQLFRHNYVFNPGLIYWTEHLVCALLGIFVPVLKDQGENGSEGMHGGIILALPTDVWKWSGALQKSAKAFALPVVQLLKDLLFINTKYIFESFYWPPFSRWGAWPTLNSEHQLLVTKFRTVETSAWGNRTCSLQLLQEHTAQQIN